MIENKIKTYHIYFKIRKKIDSRDLMDSELNELRDREETVLDKLNLERFSFYGYAYHVFSSTGNLLLVRVLFDGEEKEFDKLLKKLKLKYKKSEERLTDEISLHCQASMCVDRIKKLDIDEELLISFTHMIVNNLKFTYGDELKLFLA